jgi:hypothetical protein
MYLLPPSPSLHFIPTAEFSAVTLLAATLSTAVCLATLPADGNLFFAASKGARVMLSAL